MIGGAVVRDNFQFNTIFDNGAALTAALAALDG